jgi:hypothetical protein
MMENPNKKWMIGGYPNFRKPPYDALLKVNISCVLLRHCGAGTGSE